MTSQFQFLQAEWPQVADCARRVEVSVHSDPVAACFYARRGLELIMRWLYKHDSALSLPYQDNLAALVHEPSFRKVAGDAIFYKARAIKDLGNQAVHASRPVREVDAQMAAKELFHLCFWLVRNYARGAKPADSLAWNPALLPRATLVAKQTLDGLLKLDAEVKAKDEDLKALLANKAGLDAELEQLRTEVAELKKANAATPDAHDYTEAETRDFFIDLLLKEAGWQLSDERDREFPVKGMPNTKGEGFVDYVLWGDDGKPLAIIEAKRTRRDARVGQRQAELYADCLEKQFGQRPVIFYSNGYEHWLWDDLSHPPRAVQGFYRKDELEAMIQRRTSRSPLASAVVDKGIVERYYQERSIRHVCAAFEKDNQRKALVVMATGAGKTRTVIALCDVLMRCRWVKRVLFLCDRVALVNQAVRAFKSHLGKEATVNLVTEKSAQGRVYVSTYPTMMGLINEVREGERRFGVGHFDLVVVDEAHRSVYQKYGAIFGYFDSLLVGLTATPREEIDRNTYGLFELEDGVPTDHYSLAEAVRDGHLVPPKSLSVPLRIQREGLRYAQLTQEERERWDELEWDDEEPTPDRVEAAAVNQWFFNQDTVDKVLEQLMQQGIRVAGGDRLGKTILFAKNHDHAEFIVQRFDANYPHLKGHFARVIDFKTEYAQSLIDDFGSVAKGPHMAVSVDMLDTGIDVPEVVNLVFFKMVRSRTKFWQMLGRGTRLCPDLFGPGQHKTHFLVLDYCENLEFFSQELELDEARLQEPLGKRIFKARLELVAELDKPQGDGVGEKVSGLLNDTRSLLQKEVQAMNLENFLVRPQRKLVEHYGRTEAWVGLPAAAYAELAEQVAGLPSELPAEEEEAKRFDLLLLRTQLAVLRADPGLPKLKQQLIELTALLEEHSRIAAIRAELGLIQSVQSEVWWQDMTPELLEMVRKRLRHLVQLIEKKKRKPIYTDFADELGTAVEVQLPALVTEDDFEKFRQKVRHFLAQHEDHISLHKLRHNVPLTAQDLAELERMLCESGKLPPEHVRAAAEQSHGLGLFVRSLVGMDRGSAKAALGAFLTDKSLSANQIEFMNMVVEHLTQNGVMAEQLLFASPFTDLDARGVAGLFPNEQIKLLRSTLQVIEQNAVA